MSEPTVTITVARYNELLRYEREMVACEHAGIDNWPGWSDAMELVEMWDEEDRVNALARAEAAAGKESD